MITSINYSYPLYRPPAEADNIILQVALGCSYNNCSFCSMYKTKKYKVRDIEEIYHDINILVKENPLARKVFLADGDALSLETETLLEVFTYLKKSFIKLGRISLYASTQNIESKTLQELQLLQENGLSLIYYGIESGSDSVLKKITKGVTAKTIIDTLNKASQAKIKVSATLILGLGGTKYSEEHSKTSAEVINATSVNYLSTLQLGIEADARENFFKHFDDFEALTDKEMLVEQKQFLEQLHPRNKIIFRSNHASNAFHLSGTLPKDTPRLITEVDYALSMGDNVLVPKYFRGF
jgi:radical SAM superfamily enzyme